MAGAPWNQIIKAGIVLITVVVCILYTIYIQSWSSTHCAVAHAADWCCCQALGLSVAICSVSACEQQPCAWSNQTLVKHHSIDWYHIHQPSLPLDTVYNTSAAGWKYPSYAGSKASAAGLPVNCNCLSDTIADIAEVGLRLLAEFSH